MNLELRILVLLAAAWCLGALGVELARTRAHGRVRFYSRPAGSAWRGVLYALGPGMSPAAKESTREHRPAWLAGVSYHAGILAGLVVLGAAVLDARIAPPGLILLGFLAALGTVSGTGLLLRRLLSAPLRRLSCPDDGIANVLVTAFTALAAWSAFQPAAGPVFLAAATLLLVYIPLGKIRHCAFFFLTRFLAGSFFGRRGAYPPAG